MQGPETSGKKSVKEVGKASLCVSKMEHVRYESNSYTNVEDILGDAYWHATFDATEDSIMVIDDHCRITQANPATSRLLGKPLGQIIGTTCWQTIHGKNEPFDECPLKRSISSGKRERTNIYLAEKDIWLEVSTDPIFNFQGKVSGVVYIMRDITEQRIAIEALRKSEEKHRAIFEGAVDGIVYADRKGRVIDVNPAFTEITGIPRDQVVGKSSFSLIKRFVKPRDIPRLFKAVHRALSGKPLKLYELEINDKIVEISTPSLKKEKSGITGVIRDITERKKNQKILQENEEKYRSIFENIVDVYYRADLDGNLLLFSPSGLKVLGYDRVEETEGKNLVKDFYYYPEEREIFLRELAKHGRVVNYEVVLRRKDGTPVFGETNSHYVYDQSGKPVAVEGVFRDISDRRKTEEALRESEKRFREIFENSLIGMYQTTPEGRILTANSALVRMLGYSSVEALTARNLEQEGFEPDYSRSWFKQQIEAKGSIIGLESKWRKIDGTTLFFRESALAIRDKSDKTLYYQGTIEDITDQKRAEKALQESENRLVEAQRIAKMGDFTWDVETGEATWSDALYDLLRYDKSEKIDYAKVNAEIHHPDNLERITKWLQDCIASGREELTPNEYRLIRKDGKTIFVRTEGIIKHRAGKQPKVFATLQDITERKLAEESLKESESQLKRAQEVAHVGSWYLDLGTDRLTWSDETYRIFGVPVGESLNRSDFYAKVHPDDVARVREGMMDALKGGPYDIEHRIVVGDAVRWVCEKAEVEFDSEGRPHLVIGTVQDITEFKEMEQAQMAHLHFLESMDRIIRAIQGTNDLEIVMNDVLSEVLDVFECDRAWLLYPCDPNAAMCCVPMERTRPEYPGALTLGSHESLFPELVEHHRMALESRNLIKFGSGAGHLPLPKLDDTFNVQSQMIMALFPKIGSPWLFGLHQCSYARTWMPKDERLFQEIGRRVEDALTSLIMFRELKENKERLQEAMDAGRLGAWDWDIATGRIVWDGHHEKIFGFGPGEFDGSYATLESRIHPDDVEGFKEAIERSSREHVDYVHEYRVLRPDGTVCWVAGTGHYRWDEQGNPIRMLGVITDITKRKKADVAIRQSEEFLNSVIENTPNPMWLSDEKGTIIRINQALRELLQITDEEIVGKYNIIRDNQLKEQGLLALVESVFTDGRIVNFEVQYHTEKETQLKLRNHVQKVLELTLSPLRDSDGRLTNIICQHKDITERKKAETELREYQEKLKAMALEILQTQERERQRLAIGLHDDVCQRLVLSKLMLESSLCSISDAEMASSLKTAAETIGETIRLTESLTFELSNPVLREFGFVAALENYLETQIRGKHGIAFELDADELLGSLQEDIKTSLFRVVRELLTNVVKHAKAQKVWISVHQDQDEIHVSVRDNGVGFEPAGIKGDSTKTMRFGLFSVREQLEHLGGRLIINSEPGRGTVATVVI